MAKKKPYRFFLYIFIRAAASLLSLLPRRVLLFLAAGLGRAAYLVVSRQREKTLHHLRKAYGRKKSENEIRDLAEKSFEHLALTAADILKSPQFSLKKVSSFIDTGESFKVYDQLLAEGNGLISMTAHLGNWELLAGFFALKGYPGAVLARKIYYEPYNRWISGLRAKSGLTTIYRDDSSREILDRLKKNEIVGILPDQDVASLKGVFVDFFGRPAYTPIAPVRLALATGSPILPNFLVRTARDQYKIVLGTVIRPKIESNRDEAVLKYTQEWMLQFETVIRTYPEQWAWMHDRWKTQLSRGEKVTLNT